MTAKPGSTNRSSVNRPDDDHYPTPRSAVYPLVRANVLPPDVWEPACGEGHIASVLAEYGHTVIATNLTDRGFGEPGVDFLACREPLAPCIVTNPPYSLANEFVEHALRLGVDIACFLARTKFVEGADRYRRIHGPTPPHTILQFIDRVKFYAGDTAREDQPGWNTEAFAWFVWRRGFRGHTTLRWVWQDEGRQLDLVDAAERGAA